MIKPHLKRKGIVKIGKCHFEDNYNDLKAVFAVFIPVYIQDEPWMDVILYYGYSDYFDEIEEGSQTPEYVAVVQHIDDKIVFKEFKRT